MCLEETDVVKEIPCFVLASEKPIWSGEVANCGIILGTNALVSLGFCVIHSNGTEMHPEGHKGSVTMAQQNGTTKLEAVSEGLTNWGNLPLMLEILLDNLKKHTW